MSAKATYVQRGETVDYTPASAVTAGDIINFGTYIGIATHDIAAGALGQLVLRGVFDIVKATTVGSGFAAGSQVYWDYVNNVANVAGAGMPIGNSVITCADADATVRVYVDPQTAPLPGIVSLVGATDAVDPHTAGNYVINKAGVDAMTLAAPTAGAISAGGDDGKIIELSSNTANAHTLTATGLLETGTASVNLATFAAQKGAGLRLMAYQGKWIVKSSVGITFS